MTILARTHEPAKTTFRVDVPKGPLSTGLPALDAALQGGLRQGSVNLLLAEPGDVQELFTMHFATAGDAALYITTDRRPDALDRHWQAFDQPSERVLFHDAHQPLPSGAARDNGRLVIDSLSQYARRFGWTTAIEHLRSIQGGILETGEAALIVVFPSLHTPAELAELAIIADGIFGVDVDKTATSQVSYVRVLKMRGLSGAAKAFPATIHRDGLFLEAMKRVL